MDKAHVTYTLKTIRMADLMLRDHTYTMQYTKESRVPEASLRSVGMSVLPVVVRKKEKYCIVEGISRLVAWKNMGKKTVQVLVCEPLPADRLWRLALIAQGGKQLSDMDKALILHKSIQVFSLPFECVIHEIAPLIGVSESPRIVEEYSALMKLIRPLQKMVHEGTLPFQGAVALVRFSSAEQRMIYETIMRYCYLSAQEVKQVAEDLFGLMKREEKKLSVLLNEAGLRSVCRDKALVARERGMRVRMYLKERMNPVTHALSEAFLSVVRSLRLPPEVTVHPPRSFEDSGVTLSIQSDSRASLDSALASIQNNITMIEKLFSLDKNIHDERSL